MEKRTLAERISVLRDRIVYFANYCYTGVWREQRNNWKVNTVKTISLTVRSFLDSDLQTQACAMTYRTLLAIVPALAMIFAIGRGFGFQNLLTDQLYKLFPSQHTALEAAMKFVDSYLAQASEGVFVGVGIVFLLWTMISLLGNVETAFNQIWRVRTGRSMWRKATDYLAILLVLPILLICAGGISITMSTTLKTLLPFEFMKPAVTLFFDAMGYLFTWLFFAGAYMLIPNARVKFINAFLAGAVVGTAFQVLQWLFLTGQMYVAKYNAIYGGFSFLPLMLIWLQLVWLFTLIGALICYASQNIEQFSFSDDVDHISTDYRRQVVLTIATIIVKRFAAEKKALTSHELADTYKLPVRLVTETAIKLRDIGIVSFIESPGDLMEHPLQPALDISKITVGEVVKRMITAGASDFIPDFTSRYGAVVKVAQSLETQFIDKANNTRLDTLDVDI